MKVGIAQIAPVWLDKDKTTEKILDSISKASSEGCSLLAFGEALLPGYPFWPELTNGAQFNSAEQKEWFSLYSHQAVSIENGDLNSIQRACRDGKLAIVLGTIERASDRSGHSLYCSCLYISQAGQIESVHRKLVPTYEERLNWSPGDGHGLKVHKLEAFTVGALNCWENWMPLVRTALHAQGEDLHVAIWPGSKRNTERITQFIAEESRSYVISASGLMTKEQLLPNLPGAADMQENAPKKLADGGSCIAGPDGKWVVEPVVNEECLITAELNHDLVRQERQNLDISGHYSRPDVTQLVVNRKRQGIAEFED